MDQQFMNGVALHELFENGYRNLKKNINTINDLNVFPVPDGDTGTNMVKTFGGGLRAMSGEVQHVGQYMLALSRAVLLSARGNSGVIFSQFIHGIARAFEHLATVTFSDFIDAFAKAQEDAYSSILTPTEGTILTLIREGAEFLAVQQTPMDMKEGFAAVLQQMKASLARTPDLLPVLKEAGVVDSGAAGLVCFWEGMYCHLCGESIEDTPDLADTLAAPVSGGFGPDSVLEYGYCTEFVLQLMHAKTDLAAFDLKQFVLPLEKMGDSLVAVEGDGIVKIHIHTFTPERVLEYGRTFGEFVTVKIENMSVQHSETVTEQKREHVKYAIVAVASGAGIVDYFYEIGANVVIDGGQTNNPSVDAFLAAFRSLDAEHIVVLPNNSNIIMTAGQAAELYTDTDIQIIPTKSIVEGYSALSMMNLWCDTVEELVADMSSGLGSVTTAYLTTAIRDSQMDGVAVQKGEFIGLADKQILAGGTDRTETVVDLIHRINEQSEKEVIILFSGANVPAEETEALRARLENDYPLADIGLIDGKQEIYDYIISLE